MATDPRIGVWDESLDGSDDEDGEHEDEREKVLYAEELLESLVHSLGAPAVQVVLSHISSHEQQQPSAGAGNNGGLTSRWCLAALRCCAWAAPVSFLPHVETAMEWALNKSNVRGHGQNVLVLQERREAVTLLGVLVEQYPTLRFDYASRILGQANSTLSEVLSVTTLTTSYASLVIATCRAIVSFCRGGSAAPGKLNQELVDAALLLPHLPSLIPSLLLLLQRTSSNLCVYKQAISTIASLAQVVESEFRGYYTSVMPSLLQFIISPQTVCTSPSNLPELRGTALEAASIVGQAVDDVNLFGRDAIQLLHLATHELQQHGQGGDCTVPPDFILAACARVCSGALVTHHGSIDVDPHSIFALS
jgi:hypothetical protein